MYWRYDVTGVDTVTLHFGERIDLALVNPIQQAALALRQQLGTRLLDVVPSVAHILNNLSPRVTTQLATDTIEIPVWYDIKTGPDLPRIAELAGITERQVIELHSSQPYQVFAIGSSCRQLRYCGYPNGTLSPYLSRRLEFNWPYTTYTF